jgi:hypothetical protein
VAEFGAARQSSALAASAGAATLLLDTRTIAISAIAPIGGAICPNMIPSSDTGRELCLLNSIAMRRKSGAGALDCVRIAIRELMENVAMLRCVKSGPGAARLLDWIQFVHHGRVARRVEPVPMVEEELGGTRRYVAFRKPTNCRRSEGEGV